MKAVLVVLLAAVAACAGDAAGGDDDGCRVSLTYTPAQVFSGPAAEVRVISTVTGGDGTLAYSWNVMKSGNLVSFMDAQSDHSEIVFLATDPGNYDVTLDVAPSLGGFCPQAHANINAVEDTTAMDLRLHITPPSGVLAPVVDRPIRIHETTDYDMGPVVLEPGVEAIGKVRLSGTGIPAYVQFIPLGMAGAVVETFSDANGNYKVRLFNQPHDVLVVPAVAGAAPKLIENYTPQQTQLDVTSGNTISGIVRQGVTGISNAKVQLTIDGVPTTLTTTNTDGTFSMLGYPVFGATVKVEVTPPAGSGLPRLEATGMVDTTQSVTINYAAQTLRDVSGVPVRRGGVAQGSKKVVIVGTIASAGTVQSTINATGYFRATTTTSAGGNLPSVLAPAGPLFAVTTVAQGDLAVGSLDLTAGVPAQVDAPAMTAFTSTAIGAAENLDGAMLDLVPTRALALAGAPSMHFVANATGQVSGSVPTGGAFDVRWSDPAHRRAPLVERDRTTVTPNYTLPPAVYISGDLTVTGSSNPIVGASVQILCFDCTGIDRNRPIAEVASDPHGSFSIAVPDPAAL